MVDLAVPVREDIPLTDDLAPRHLRVASLRGFAHSSCRLADEFQAAL